ncbi:multidrug resistance efflux transporter family protein [Staphylococcus ureilyticus]
MFPFLLIMVIGKHKTRHHVVLLHIKQHFFAWLLWSSLAFVFFYVPITFVSNYSPGWLISATWQLTIICGLLTAPFFYTYIQQDTATIKVRERIAWRPLITSSIMILGVIIVQIPHISNIDLHIFLLSVLPLIVAAFCYPLGIGEMLLLGLALPNILSIVGIMIITFGIIIYCFLNSKINNRKIEIK